MNQGSIETRSSAASAVEFLGVRAPAADFSSRSQRPNERFDTIFDSLQQRTANDELRSSLNREDHGSSAVEAKNWEKDEAVQQSPRDEVEQPHEEKEVVSSSNSEASDSAKQKVDKEESKTERSASDGENSEPAASEKSDGEPENKPGTQIVEVPGKTTSENGKAKVSNGEVKRAVKVTEEGKVSSSKSFQLQTQKSTIVKDADAEKSAKTPVLRNAGEKPGIQASDKTTIEPKQSVKAVSANAINQQPKAGVETSADSGNAAKAVEAASKTTTPTTQNLKTAPDQGSENKAASKVTSPASQNLKAAPDQDHDGKVALKKSANHQAKTSSVSHESLRTADSTILKSPLKSAGLQAEGRLAQFDHEIGIKTAEQSANKQSKMLSEVKSSESAGSEKGFLKEANPNGSLNRAQAVTSRSDAGGFSSNSHFGGHQGQRDANSGGRGSEHFRQWVDGASDVRSVSQAAQQGDFVDRAVGSALSARVVNQIMNHIDRLRDSEKSRVKVSLGGNASGVTVDIRIEGDAIFTSFEGDPQILNQLKEEWDDIKDRATQRGVSLSDPEFVEISYSSSSESESFLPDDGIAKEGKSQSVIQHENNQPVRPGEMTAAAGSSGPVHSFYA